MSDCDWGGDGVDNEVEADLNEPTGSPLQFQLKRPISPFFLVVCAIVAVPVIVFVVTMLFNYGVIN